MLIHNQSETLPFIIRYRQQAISADRPEVEQIRLAAKTGGIAVAFGYSERSGGTLYMSQMLIDRDGVMRQRTGHSC